jgi:hypothetical protein
MSALIDMTGQRFGRLVVIDRAGSALEGRAARATWRCDCDCGRTTVATGAHLREGNTQSCGCLQIEQDYGK